MDVDVMNYEPSLEHREMVKCVERARKEFGEMIDNSENNDERKELYHRLLNNLFDYLLEKDKEAEYYIKKDCGII